MYPAPRPMVVPAPRHPELDGWLDGLCLHVHEFHGWIRLDEITENLKKNMHSCCKLLLTYSKLSFLCHTEAGNSIKYM